MFLGVFALFTTFSIGMVFADESKTSQSSGPNGHLAPPLKQIKAGTQPHNVVCDSGLELAQKNGDRMSVCVKLETKIELTVRGWAQDDRVMLGCIGERVSLCYPKDTEVYRNELKKYYGIKICTSEYPTVTISSPDHDPEPSTIILKIGVNNTTCWTNESDEPVTLTSEDGRWSTGILYPYDSKFIQFNQTAFYKYHGQPQTAINGRIAIISDQTEFLPIMEKLQIAREIIKIDMGNPITGIGVGNADNVLDITIHEGELKKNPNAEEYYKKRYQDMIPFDIPIRIDFGHVVPT